MNCSLCGHARAKHAVDERGPGCLPTCAFCDADLERGEITPGCPVCSAALDAVFGDIEQLPLVCDQNPNACPNERCWREQKCRRT